MELDFMKVAENFGFPALVLVFVGFAIRAIARFFAPLITASFTRFWGMMDTTTDSIRTHTIILTGITDRLIGHGHKFDEVVHRLDEHGNKLDSHGQILSELRVFYVKKGNEIKPGDSGIIKS
jgi:hypothetical protein